MHLSKFDLYRSEWLELVFNDRNKEYGAYDLRKHYAGNLAKAIGITFFSIAAILTSYAVFHRYYPITPVIPPDAPPIVVTLMPNVPPKPTTTPKAQSAPTVKNPPMVASPDPVSQPPVTIDEFKGKDIGPVTSKGKDDGKIDIPSVTPGTGTSTAPKVDDGIHDTGGLDIMPEPYGGEAAWSKFLSKNIHYPSQAIDAGTQGKVWISFIIEKDGHLSNIVVERGPGHGLDDEALRVLKLAPAWKPGKQNGQSVRVKYTIPISFILPDNG